MAQHRSLKETNKYYVPREEFLTALHYCRQYPAWMAELKALPDSGKGIDTEKEHVQTSNSFDPVSSLAIRRAGIAKKKRIVDETVHEVAQGLDDWLILSVCFGYTYRQLDARKIPCSRGTFYSIRRRFYFELSKKI